MKVASAEKASENKAYKAAVAELLFQLADDDFIIAYRGSEWLGLAPHIEEDVAFSSISQDTMGHAAMFFQLLEDLGEGAVDDIAHARQPEQRRNAVLLELVNGPGNYLVEPRYDWAFTVVRQYFYATAKKTRMEWLRNSSYEPLAETASRINIELYYHILHWKTWFVQLMKAGGEARTRMEQALHRVCSDFDEIFSCGSLEKEIVEFGLIGSKTELEQQWRKTMISVFTSVGFELPEAFGAESGSGRNGEHTLDLVNALETLSEVYRIDPVAGW